MTKERVQRTRSAEDDDDDREPDSASSDELFGRMARVRSNLGQLLYAGGDVKLLSLVVELQKPIFNAPTPPFIVTPSNPSTPSPLEFVPIGRDGQCARRGRLCADPRFLGDRENHGYRRVHLRAGEEGQDCAVELVHALCSRYHSDEARTQGRGKEGAGTSFGVL